MADDDIVKLKKITILGYKSISADCFSQVDLDDINIIIGANGSGKSNFISFFKMLNNMMTGALQTFIGKNGSANNLLFLGAKKTPMLSASLEFENKSNIDIYNFTLVKSVQDSLIFSEEEILWNGKKIPLGGGHKESLLVFDEAKYPAQKIVRGVLRNCRTFQFHDTSDTSHIRNSCYLDNNRFLFSDAGNVAAVLYLLQNKNEYERYYKRIVMFVKRIMPNFDDFFLEPHSLNSSYIKLRWKQIGESDYVFGPDQLSDGAIRFIALATLFLQPPDLLPKVIIIDEPELGLHPQAIDILAVMIKMASQNSQIIAATQSPRLLDNFEPENIIVAENDKNNNCSTYKRLKIADYEAWLKDYSISQLWDKNVIGGQP